MTTGFISFAGGDFLWKRSLRRIRDQASKSHFFHKVSVYDPRKLADLTSAKEYDFICSNPRGYGYWIWKPLIVLDFLSQHHEIDTILYADAGCDLNFNSDSNINWFRYLKELESHDAIVFKMELIEKHWTKQEVFNNFPIFEQHRNSEQILGGVFLMKREFAISFCNRWLEIMRRNSYALITNEYNPEIQNPEFIQPRHDQSIFSLLAKQESNILILDSLQELYFEPNWDKGKNYPIWTSRNKSGVPKYDLSLNAQITRIIEKILRKLFL